MSVHVYMSTCSYGHLPDGRGRVIAETLACIGVRSIMGVAVGEWSAIGLYFGCARRLRLRE